MRITLITGFLGAGKTTFLRRFLASHTDAGTGAIINDLSELEVDGELVRMGHHVTEEAGTLVPPLGGLGGCAGGFNGALAVGAAVEIRVHETGLEVGQEFFIDVRLAAAGGDLVGDDNTGCRPDRAKSTSRRLSRCGGWWCSSRTPGGWLSPVFVVVRAGGRRCGG